MVLVRLEIAAPWLPWNQGYFKSKEDSWFKNNGFIKLFKIRPTRKSHYLKNINLHYFNSSCSFRMERKTEAFFQLSCSFPPADKVEERGLAVASIISLFGISYTKWESIVHFWVFSEMEHFTVSAFCGVWQGDKLQTLQQLKADLATNEMN